MIEDEELEEDEAPIEPEPVPASHLFEIPCRTCGKTTLAVPEHLRDATCGPCLTARVGTAVGEVGLVGPVVARWQSERPPPTAQEFWHKDAKRKMWVQILEQPNVHPAPEVLGKWGAEMPDLAPEPVLKLAELAREAGWEVRVSRARGNGVHGSTGRPTALRDSIALSFGLHPLSPGTQAVCVYVRPASGGTWSWGSVWLWGRELPHFGLCGFTELKEWLAAGGQVPGDWYAQVRARVAGAENLKAQRTERLRVIKGLHSEEVCVQELARYFELEEAEVRKIVAPAKAKKDHAD